jgi:hypothetical protein
MSIHLSHGAAAELTLLNLQLSHGYCVRRTDAPGCQLIPREVRYWTRATLQPPGRQQNQTRALSPSNPNLFPATHCAHFDSGASKFYPGFSGFGLDKSPIREPAAANSRPQNHSCGVRTRVRGTWVWAMTYGRIHWWFQKKVNRHTLLADFQGLSTASRHAGTATPRR